MPEDAARGEVRALLLDGKPSIPDFHHVHVVVLIKINAIQVKCILRDDFLEIAPVRSGNFGHVEQDRKIN